MDKTLRSVLWILVGLVVLSSFSAGLFFVAKERIYNDYLNLDNLFKTTTERLDKEIASSNKENMELHSKLGAVKGELAVLESSNRLLASQYGELLGEKKDLDTELIRVKKVKFSLEEKLKDMESETFLASLLKDKILLEVELKRLKGSFAPKDLEIKKLEVDVMDLNMNVSKLKEGKALLERKLKDSNEVAEILSMDLLKEKGKAERHKEAFENMKTETNFLEAKVSDLKKVKDRFDKLLAEKEDMQFRISSLEKDLEHKNNQLNRLEVALGERKEDKLRAEAYHAPEEVELPPIVLEREYFGVTRPSISPLERISEMPTLKGRIVTVNKEHGFVVIDLGKEGGIDIGDSLNVYRGDFMVGSIEVIQTRERIAACDIKYVEEGFYIEIEDVVKKR